MKDPIELDLPIETAWTLRDAISSSKSKKLIMSVPFLLKFWLSLRILRDTWHVGRNCFYDFLQVVRYSSAVTTGNTRRKLEALITMAYHGIEKGLSLPNPRPGFGKEQVKILISRLHRYQCAFGSSETSRIAIDTLQKYCDFNELHGTLDLDIQSCVKDLSRNMAHRECHTAVGGVKLVKRGEFFRSAKLDLLDFFNSRASVRQYDETPVALELIRRAIDMARKTPSCCNRQSWKIWVLHDREKIEKALDIQGGARGFKQEVPMVLVVTADLACFQSSGERYQAWIDGGMFAMSVVYALHSLGLVSCFLNWSKCHDTDKLFKAEFNIPPNENIIVLLSVGHPKEQFYVAQSTRLPVEELMKVI